MRTKTFAFVFSLLSSLLLRLSSDLQKLLIWSLFMIIVQCEGSYTSSTTIPLIFNVNIFFDFSYGVLGLVQPFGIWCLLFLKIFLLVSSFKELWSIRIDVSNYSIWLNFTGWGTFTTARDYIYLSKLKWNRELISFINEPPKITLPFATLLTIIKCLKKVVWACLTTLKWLC